MCTLYSAQRATVTVKKTKAVTHHPGHLTLRRAAARTTIRVSGLSKTVGTIRDSLRKIGLRAPSPKRRKRDASQRPDYRSIRK